MHSKSLLTNVSSRITLAFLFVASAIFSPYNIDASVAAPAAQASYPIVIQVAQGADDASENPDAGCPFDFGANEAYIGECFDGAPIVAGFRFVTGTDFPNVSMITEAHLELTVDGPYSNPMEVRIFGALWDNDPFDVTPPSARVTTQAFTSWFITEHWEYTEKRNTPDISHVIREIVSQPSWSPGDPIAIIVTSRDAQSTHRRFFGWERDPLTAARLVVNDPAPSAPGAGDRDGDGLLDKWETEGYDHNADGQVDVDLPALGADPDVPDIFVQVDWLEEGGILGHIHKPPQAAIDKVVMRFLFGNFLANSINFHVQFGNAIPETNANRLMGVADGRPEFNCGDFDWSGFQQIKDAYFIQPTPERLPIYHYALFAHDAVLYCGKYIGGISRNVWDPLDPNRDGTFHGGASDFIVSLGDPGLLNLDPYRDDTIGGTFMHELGHNLD